MRAADLFAKGVSQADIGRELEVSHQTVSDWHEKWAAGGKQALKRTGQPGRPPKVSDADLAKVERALERGPEGQRLSHRAVDAGPGGRGDREGHRGEVPPRHVWRVLRQMGWSRQRPARRAMERDDEAIEQWVNERWPKVKKTPGPGTPGSSSKTRAGSASSPR